MVLYRKYRPQTLDELDLADTREKLILTLASSYKPHAYLFYGPKGTGKTSAARIVSKILNCQNRKGTQPCNKCDSCMAITEGRHFDVLEIDAASNRGIDEIRDLREKIRLAPVTSQYKIYIIDEVHMLTNDAFNALLKTLEEPPLHAVFILATTEIDKLPETIVSRITKLSFRKANADEVIHSLKRVINGEKIKIEDETLQIIAEHADGSFRDATKLLEQILSQKATSYKDAASLFGMDTMTPEKFLNFLYQKDTKKLLEAIVSMSERGADFRLFVSSLLNILHSLILENYGISQTNFPKDLTSKFSIQEINRLVKLFSEVYSQLKFASRPELALETSVVEWCENYKN